jgi:hypothetical protein
MIEPIMNSTLNLLRQTYQSLIWMGVAAFMLTSSTAPRLASIVGNEEPASVGQKNQDQIRIRVPNNAPSLATMTNWIYEDAVILP